MWDVVPTSEDDAILGAGTTGVHSFIELKNGDDVSVKNLHLSSTEAANVHLKIPYGARLSVLNAIYPTKQGIKNVTNTGIVKSRAKILSRLFHFVFRLADNVY